MSLEKLAAPRTANTMLTTWATADLQSVDTMLAAVGVVQNQSPTARAPKAP